MAASEIYLSGGPCDGRTVSANQIVGGLVAYIKCGGGFYVLDDGVTRPDGDAVFKWAGKTKPGPPAPPTVKASHVHKGWQDVRHSVNVNMPKALRTSQRQTSAALRVLARARRVRN